MVTGIDAEGLSIGSERIKARTVLWAAGVAASPLGACSARTWIKAGRVVVEPDLTIAGRPEVYVIGDLAHFEQDGRPVPGVAPAAMQMGKHAAQSILRGLEGKPREPFRYVDKGSLATIGRGAAVAHLGRLKISGFFAWLLWLFIHILFLIGFRNRLFVMISVGLVVHQLRPRRAVDHRPGRGPAGRRPGRMPSRLRTSSAERARRRLRRPFRRIRVAIPRPRGENPSHWRRRRATAFRMSPWNGDEGSPERRRS